MSNKNNQSSNAKVITGEVTLSYPHLWEPQPPMNDNEKPKYSAVFVVTDGEVLKPLKKAALEVARNKWGEKAPDLITKGKLMFPFRTDWEDKGYPEDSTYFSARSAQRPGVVSIYPDKDGKPSLIKDKEEVYPGCLVKASVTFFAYDKGVNRGVGVALNNLQKVRDGDRLDSRVAAQDEFEADPDAAASLEDTGIPSGTGDPQEDEDELDLESLL